MVTLSGPYNGVIYQSATRVAAALALVPLPGTRVFTGSVVSMLILLLAAGRASSPLSVWARNTLFIGSFASIAATLLAFLYQVFSGQKYTLNPEMAFVAMSIAVSCYSLFHCSLLIGYRQTALLASVPLIVIDYVQRSSQGNSWKYAIGISVSFLVLFLLQDSRRTLWATGVFTLVLVSLSFETRSIAALIIIALAIEFFNISLKRAGYALKTLVAFSSISLGYVVFYNTLLRGTFGSGLAELTYAQSQGDPLKLITGARPEAQGNAQIIFQDLFRLTPGQNLTSDQAALFLNSFSLSNRDTNSGYVLYALNANEFHSVFADFWFHLGAPGVILSFLLIFALSRAFVLASRLTFHLNSSFSPKKVVIYFVILRVGTDLAFSPLSDTRMWALYALAFLPFVKKDIHD